MADLTVPATTRRALRARRAAAEQPDAELLTARAASEAALKAAGIAVHEVHALADLAAVRRVFDTLWSADPTNPAVTVELLRAYAHTGQYVVIATDLAEAGRPVIAAGVGFLASPPGVALHSNVVGVLPPGRGRSLGFALKLHQRTWVMERGLSQVTWTFDPLIRRNAWFNLTKLGARPVEYLIDFYGPMADGINAGDASDRLFLSWPVAAPTVVEAVAGRAVAPHVESLLDVASVLLRVAPDGRSPSGPVAPPAPGEGPDVALAQVPPDVEALRHEDPGLGRAWRQGLRRVLHGAMGSGWSLTGFDRGGWYVLTRAGTDRT